MRLLSRDFKKADGSEWELYIFDMKSEIRNLFNVNLQIMNIF